ncbi:MAG TPA: hypothetical protein VFU21_08325 [Kofleriaceae bacterium]|nr:hypothetical protein [Kofleriaceae bacterium]
MKIYRFTPRIEGHAHPWRSVAGRWWPDGIDLGPAMAGLHDLSSHGIRPHADGRYDRSPEELATSDFPVLSLQVPVVSQRAAEALALELAGRLRPIRIGGEPFFAVQPLLAVRGEPHAFLPEQSSGIRLSGGEVVHYHTRAFDPSRLRGEFFTLPAHEPFAETYVTEVVIERARAAGLTGLEDVELVFDDGPIAPRHTPPAPAALERPSYRQELEWELFKGRGSLWSYLDDELSAAFRAAVLAGLLPI